MKVLIREYRANEDGYQYYRGNEDKKLKKLVDGVERSMGNAGKNEDADTEGYSIRYEPLKDGNEYFFCVIFRTKSAQMNNETRQYRQYVGFLLDAQEADQLFQYAYPGIEEALRDNARFLLRGNGAEELFAQILEDTRNCNANPDAVRNITPEAQRALYLGAYYADESYEHQSSIVASVAEQQAFLNWLLQELPLPLRKTVSFFRNALDYDEASKVALVFSAQNPGSGEHSNMFRTKYLAKDNQLIKCVSGPIQLEKAEIFLPGEKAEEIRKQARDYFDAYVWDKHSAQELWGRYEKLCRALQKPDRESWKNAVEEAVGGSKYYRKLVQQERILRFPYGDDSHDETPESTPVPPAETEPPGQGEPVPKPTVETSSPVPSPPPPDDNRAPEDTKLARGGRRKEKSSTAIDTVIRGFLVVFILLLLVLILHFYPGKLWSIRQFLTDKFSSSSDSGESFTEEPEAQEEPEEPEGAIILKSRDLTMTLNEDGFISAITGTLSISGNYIPEGRNDLTNDIKITINGKAENCHLSGKVEFLKQGKTSEPHFMLFGSLNIAWANNNKDYKVWSRVLMTPASNIISADGEELLSFGANAITKETFLKANGENTIASLNSPGGPYLIGSLQVLPETVSGAVTENPAPDKPIDEPSSSLLHQISVFSAWTLFLAALNATLNVYSVMFSGSPRKAKKPQSKENLGQQQ